MSHRIGSGSRARLRGANAGELGFTLIELMVTAGVIAILAAIAYANYAQYVTNSRRAAATGCLLETAQFLERYYTTRLTYIGAPNPPPQCDPEVAQFYTVSYAVAPAAKTYTLAATPLGSQLARDTACGVLSLTAQGGRGEGGTATNITDCW